MLHLLARDARDRWPALAAACLAIAVVGAAVVAERSISASAEQAVHGLAHRLGRNMLVIPRAADVADFHAQRFGPETLPDDAADVLRRSPLAEHVQVIQPLVYGRILHDGVPLVIVGESSTVAVLPGGRVDAVLGEEAARLLGVRAGDSVALGGMAIHVREVTSRPREGLDRGVFVSLDGARRILGRTGGISALRLGGCWCRVDVPTLGAQVERLLPGTRAITLAAVLKAQKETVASVQRYAGVLHAVALAAVVAIVFAVVASWVRRQVREVGLLLALGASRGRVGALVAAKAAVLGGVGGVAGYALGVPVAHAVGVRLLGVPLEPPLELLPVLVGAGAGAALVAALWPALRAAETDPAEVLRETA